MKMRARLANAALERSLVEYNELKFSAALERESYRGS
jgi:hypothetical protein